jgi:4-amino-4-deoxy-L-arabinose transferase-like glycosyltransferase
VAAVVRVVYILHWRHGVTVGGDSRYYHEGANLLANGHGFIDPFQFLDAGRAVAAADHPPAYIVYLAAFSFVGLESATAHMLASAALGVVTVVLIGYVAREVGGTRTGLVAAAIAAIYPNLWAYDGALESETVAQFAVALALLASYLWWRQPTARRAALLGAGVALGALTRAEMAALVVLLAVPLVVFRAALDRRERLRQFAIVFVAFVVVLAPWCIYNLTRFDRPTFISTGFGPALVSGACDDAFYGGFTGYWSRQCQLDAIAQSGLPDGADRSRLDEAQRHVAVDYLKDHVDRLPVVAVARVGRITGLYHLSQQERLDSFVGGRDDWVAWSQWWSFFAASILAIVGAVLLRRQRTPVFPLTSFVVLVLLTTIVFFGLVRYRAVAEVSLVVLAAVAVDAVVTKVTARP